MSSRLTWFIPLGLVAASISCSGQAPQPESKPKFGEFKCRADAQRWTLDLDNSPKSLQSGLLIMVNGQMRNFPQLTYGATVADLVERIYEMQVCIGEDPTFQKQFNTYRLMRDNYESERTFRYMNFIIKHNLDEQFRREDADEFKLQK